MNESQKKRIQKLIEMGLYHEPKIIKGVCKLCGKEYEYDENNKVVRQYFTNGFCCNKCYQDSGLKLINKIKTTLTNANMPFNDENILEVFSEYQSNRTKKCADTWRKTMVEKYGTDYATKRGKMGWDGHKKKFLIENNIISEDDFSKLSEEEIDDLFISNFNKITKHGEHVVNGRKSKYGEDYKKSFQDALVKSVTNLMEKKYGKEYLDGLSDSEYQEVYNECSTEINSKKVVKDRIEWKKSTLLNHGFDKDSLDKCSSDEIEKFYSEYLSKRKTKLVCSEKNGYKHSEKGWYNFDKWDKFFYRSSWEKRLCEELDANCDLIENVMVPEPIYYKLNGVTHAYFCDFEILFKNGFRLFIEVKPEGKLKELVNECKINAAKEKWGDSFIVATEHEIFSSDLKNLLMKYGKD